MERSLAPLQSLVRSRGFTSSDSVTPVSPWHPSIRRAQHLAVSFLGRGQEGTGALAMRYCVFGTSLFPADRLSIWLCPWRTLQVSPVAVAALASLVTVSADRALCTRPCGKRVAVGVLLQAPASISRPLGRMWAIALTGSTLLSCRPDSQAPTHCQSPHHWAASSLQCDRRNPGSLET